ncbi:MAG TPA: putative 2OG-Fe(II) oxygenase [Gammaproteobacteria bacterium]|nr:putative 2OG-Fe(II) oxygenase [Gammaproteobacteria bacterium]
MSQRMVFPLFSTPVYVNNVGEFLRPDLESLEYSSTLGEFSYNFQSSVDKNVLDRPEWQGVHALVMQEINAYAREVLAVNKGIEFFVTNSWVNIHRRGQSAGPHVHHNSLISGVLYLRVTETTGDLLFHRNDLSLIPFPPALDLDMDSFNIYNCKSWAYRPKTNDICLFPSVVMHSADFNRSDEERACLAFNVFVRGSFGGHHKLNLR